MDFDHNNKTFLNIIKRERTKKNTTKLQQQFASNGKLCYTRSKSSSFSRIFIGCNEKPCFGQQKKKNCTKNKKKSTHTQIHRTQTFLTLSLDATFVYFAYLSLATVISSLFTSNNKHESASRDENKKERERRWKDSMERERKNPEQLPMHMNFAVHTEI